MQVDLQFHGRGGVQGQLSQRYTGGYVVLTTHNLVWLDAAAGPQPGRSCMLPLQAITSAALRASHMLAQAKLCVQVSTDWQGRPSHDGQQSTEVRLCKHYHYSSMHTTLRDVALPLGLQPWQEYIMVSLQVKLVTKHLQPLHDELQKSLSQALWQRRGRPSTQISAG